jgi:hypothetical protein
MRAVARRVRSLLACFIFCTHDAGDTIRQTFAIVIIIACLHVNINLFDADE